MNENGNQGARMDAVTVRPGYLHSVDVERVPLPELRPYEIMVKTICVGLDGTDHEINEALYGRSPNGEDYLILGHEAFGVISEIGRDVSGFSVGELVVPTVRRPGNCIYCKMGMQDMCLDGDYAERGIIGHHGYLSEFFRVDPRYLVKIPPSLEHVAVLLEPMSIAEKGIREAWRMQNNRMPWKPRTVLVLGLGSLGLLAAILLRLRKLDVIVYSLEPEFDPKVELLTELDIEYYSGKDINMEDVPENIGKNIDFIFEATGNSTASINSMSMLGTNGILCLTGVTGGHKKITICADCLNLDMVLGNKVIFGTVNSNIADFQQGVDDMLLIEQDYPGFLKKLITQKIPIEKKQRVIAAMEDKKGIKTIITF